MWLWLEARATVGRRLGTFSLRLPYAGNADGSHTVVADGMNFAIGLTRGPDGALYVSTTAYGLENDPSVPDVQKAVGIGKIVRFSP